MEVWVLPRATISSTRRYVPPLAVPVSTPAPVGHGWSSWTFQLELRWPLAERELSLAVSTSLSVSDIGPSFAPPPRRLVLAPVAISTDPTLPMLEVGIPPSGP